MLHQLMINDSHENSDPSTPDIPERELACILTAQNSLMTLIKKAEHECIFLPNFIETVHYFLININKLILFPSRLSRLGCDL